jgi:transcriptional regulator with XRE-family HTH domain
MATKTTGERIRAARIAAGLTVGTEFAEKIGVKPHTLWRYEKDQIEPSAKVLLRIAHACGVTMEFLLEGKNKRSGAAA